MAEVKFSPQALKAYESLERAGAVDLLDDIDDAVDLLEEDPGDRRARRRSFRDGRWGITLKDADDDWLLIWQMDDEDPEIVRVRYLGADPFA
jgi:ParE toxin of type II toxin-antitoxin system, parDE